MISLIDSQSLWGDGLLLEVSMMRPAWCSIGKHECPGGVVADA